MQEIRQSMFGVVGGLEQVTNLMVAGAPQLKEAGGTELPNRSGHTVLQLLSAMRDSAVGVAKFFEHLDALRGDAESGDTVELLCDGPDGCRVVCCGNWTGWAPVAFDGTTVPQAVAQAAETKAAQQAPLDQPNPMAQYMADKPGVQYVVMPVGLLERIPALSQRYLTEAFMIVKQDLQRANVSWPPPGCSVHITLLQEGEEVADPYAVIN